MLALASPSSRPEPLCPSVLSTLSKRSQKLHHDTRNSTFAYQDIKDSTGRHWSGSISQKTDSSPSSSYQDVEADTFEPELDFSLDSWCFSGQAMSSVYGNYSPATSASVFNDYPSSSQVLDSKPLNALGYAHNGVRQHSFTESTTSRTGSRKPSPVLFEKPAGPDSNGRPRFSTHHAVASYLRLPVDIANGRQGSLASFTAEITCLFWFESAATLAGVERSPQCPTPATRLAPDANPTTGFMKWVTTILTTTQVSTSVVLLALLFIYRLKNQNPHVNGKAGSEYRLLTVALMLGNKFLDDNTYTNKTWAEVSGIDVKEIHVMEVEFLSHMKYNLYTSKEQWKDWFTQLNKFWTYHEWALRKSSEFQSRLAIQRPPILQIPWTLPSPPASATESPPYGSAASPDSAAPAHLSTLPSQLAASIISPAVSLPDYEQSVTGRKRSWDENALEPVAKRQHVTPVRFRDPRLQANHPSTRPEALPSLPSLPFPNLPMPNSQQQFYGGQERFTPQSLPQVQSYSQSGRITPSAYLPAANWLHGLPQPSSSSQRPSNAMSYALSSAHSTAYPSRHPTPTSSFQTSAPFESQPQLSPSHYLEKRTSPYRPVRNISQLTQAPPSRDMYEYPAQVSNDQIQYQPLKKNVDDRDTRTGTVPYYYNHSDPYTWPTLPAYDNGQPRMASYAGVH